MAQEVAAEAEAEAEATRDEVAQGLRLQLIEMMHTMEARGNAVEEETAIVTVLRRLAEVEVTVNGAAMTAKTETESVEEDPEAVVAVVRPRKAA